MPVADSEHDTRTRDHNDEATITSTNGDRAAPHPAGRTARRARRMRRLAGYVGVGVLVTLVVALGVDWYLDRRAEQRARVLAATNEVRDDIIARYEAIETAARSGSEAAASLRLTLQEHLTISERSDEQLATDRDVQRGALVRAGEELQQQSQAPAPEIPELANEGALRDDLDRLTDVQQRAGDLGGRYVAAAGDAQRWSEALDRLRAQANRYVETVQAQPETHDPAQLKALWEEERAVLEEYRAAAEAAVEVPGLKTIAEAYLAYVGSNLTFAGEAMALLDEGELDAYNDKLARTFDVEDPFGFQAAVADATERSFDAGVLGLLGEVREEGTNLGSEVSSYQTEIRQRIRADSR